MKFVILQVFYAIFSGIIQGLAIPNEFIQLGSPVLTLVSLVPLYISLYKAKSYRESFLIMFLQTLTVHLISSFWLANFRDFAIFTLGASALGTAFEGGLIGIIFHLLPSMAGKSSILEENAGKKQFCTAARIFWFAACWITYEWMKSTGFLGYPWGTLFLSAYRWKIFTQIASISGKWGVSFIYALFNALLGEGILILERKSVSRSFADSYIQTAKFCAVLYAVIALYGLYQYFMPRFPAKTMQIVAVQQNIDPWEGGEEKSIRLSMDITEKNILKCAELDKPADLVLWSEGVLCRSFPNSRSYYENNPEDESLSDFIKRMGVPFIIGGQTILNRQKKHYCNSAIFYDVKGRYAGFYSKRHLVPFAERIPFQDSQLMKYFMEKTVGFSSGWTPGRQNVIFKIPVGERRYLSAPLEYMQSPSTEIALNIAGKADLKKTNEFIENEFENPDNYVSFSVPICFEDAFPDVCRTMFNAGSEVFMNITNDSWSKTASAQYQHFAAASYIAIEFRTTLVRCANSGYSVVVNPAGKIIDDMPIFTEGALTSTVPVYEHKPTLYSMLGDWFVYAILFFMIIYALYALIKLKNIRVRLVIIEINAE